MNTHSLTTNLQPLVDGDVLRYRCGFAADSQRRKQLKEQHPDLSEGDIEQLLSDEDYLGYALSNVKESLTSTQEMFTLPPLQLYLSGSGNFREQVATILPYKGNRTARKPKYYEEIGQYMKDVWRAIVVEGQEADDALGIEQYGRTDNSTVIVSIDKDLDMIPGWHYNLMRKELYEVSERDADIQLFRQMLIGDRTDNIPGIEQVGDVRAEKLLASVDYDVDAVRSLVKAKYQEQYANDWERAYREVGTLLWIRREPEQECVLL